MSYKANGELVPTGGGDNIPLIREKLSIGRRDSCDIRLQFPNVSGLHAELTFRNGYWYIRDCNSTNGVKVNGTRVLEKLLHPREKITIGKRDYTIQYELPADHIGQQGAEILAIEVEPQPDRLHGRSVGQGEPQVVEGVAQARPHSVAEKGHPEMRQGGHRPRRQKGPAVRGPLFVEADMFRLCLHVDALRPDKVARRKDLKDNKDTNDIKDRGGGGP